MLDSVTYCVLNSVRFVRQCQKCVCVRERVSHVSLVLKGVRYDSVRYVRWRLIDMLDGGC